MSAKPERPFDRAHGEPGGGHWFYLQKHMHEHYGAAAGGESGAARGGVMMAWGKKGRSGGFTFAWYASAEAVLRALLSLAPDARFGFEQITAEQPCRAYADVEWEGARDERHERVALLWQALRRFCARVFPGKCMQLYVSCSSRPGAGGVWKNSYHVHVANLLFAQNHNGDMKAFWEALAREELAGSEWYWTKKSACGGEETRLHVIDMAVYTKNRNMRLPLCMKRGGVAFVRISGDPLADDADMTARFDDKDIAALLPFFVGNAVEREGDVQAAASPAARVRAKRAAPEHAAAAPARAKAARGDGGTHAGLLAALPPSARGLLVCEGTVLSPYQVEKLPRSLKHQMAHGALQPEDIVHMYVQNPRVCVTQLYMQGVERLHRGNNSICVVAPATADCPAAQVFVKCLCASRSTPRVPIAAWNKLGELPDYDRTHTARRIVETPHGIHNVEDSANRLFVRSVYTKQGSARAYELWSDQKKARWHSVLACDEGWQCIPAPTAAVAPPARS